MIKPSFVPTEEEVNGSETYEPDELVHLIGPNQYHNGYAFGLAIKDACLKLMEENKDSMN